MSGRHPEARAAMTSTTPTGEPAGFRHEAMLYAGTEGFMTGSLDFIRTGLAGEESVLVVVRAAKMAALRAALGAEADAVAFADMAEVGANPARIIPAWRDFVDDNRTVGRSMRGIGEPIDSERTADELAECHVHEALLNVAFADAAPWTLLCPYDVSSLPESVVDEARRNHPVLVEHGIGSPSRDCRHDMADVLAEPLPQPAPEAVLVAFAFDGSMLADVRDVVHRHAQGAASSDRVDGFVLSAYEAATNSVRHAGGFGSIRMWSAPDSLVCEVCDAGRIADPLAGRARPSVDQDSGRGLWLVHQLCDLVQVRVLPTGNVVRIHLRDHDD